MIRRAHLFALTALSLIFAPGVARAAAPGALDPSFGSGGVATPAGVAQLFGVAVQSGGAVIAAGQSSAGSAVVARLTTAGRVDPSFGAGGHATGPAGIARAVALQSDGKIVVAGTSGGMFVERLNANGSADPSFGTGGVARAFGGSGAANGVAIQPDGKIVVVGSVNPIDTRIAVARFNANGRLDTSFGSGGSEVVELGLPYAVAEGVAIQPDGGIVIVGHEQGSPNFGFFNGLVIRLSSNGKLDPGYGSATPAGGVGGGRTAVQVSASPTGLAPGTTYHYRIDASNVAGSGTGQDATSTTAPATGAPSAVTGAAHSVSEVSATVIEQVRRQRSAHHLSGRGTEGPRS